MSKSDDKQPPSPRRRRFLKWATGAALIGTGGAVAYGESAGADDLQVVRVDVPIAGWPAGPLTLGLLADMHCNDGRAVARTRHAAEMLAAQRPDVVALAGDFVSGWPSIWSPRAADALAPLAAAPGGVFCVLGNHDWSGGGQFQTPQELRRVGFRPLSNEAAPLAAVPGVWMVGLEDIYHHRQDPERALAGVPLGACKILLVHEPDYADMAQPGFALQLSGHSHGGQVRVPGLPPLHVPRYSTHYPEGLRQGPHHPVYTTRGVGMTGVQMRLFCPPEVTVLRLHAPAP